MTAAVPVAAATAQGDDAILDAAFLARLRSLFVRIRRRRRQRRLGAEATPAAGQTREFRDRRQYVRGDDFRSVDWRLYARLDRLFVRVFEEIHEYHVHLVLDRSCSMARPHAAKRRDALRVVAGLAYLALSHGHRVSLHSVGAGARRELPPLKGQGHIHRLIEHLLRVPFDGRSELSGELDALAPGRGVLFLVSDGYAADPAACDRWLTPLRRFPGEAHLVRVADPAEADPGAIGEVLLEDVETRELRRVDLTHEDAARYRDAYRGFVEAVRGFCTQWRIGHHEWSTAAPFDDQLLALLERGGALGQG